MKKVKVSRYFKPQCFSFFKPGFHQQFPLFDLLHTNLFKFDHITFESLAPFFEDVFTAYERSTEAQHIEAKVKLLGLLYQLEDVTLGKKKDTHQKYIPPCLKTIEK